MGRSQVVKAAGFDPAIPGSNPGAPAIHLDRQFGSSIARSALPRPMPRTVKAWLQGLDVALRRGLDRAHRRTRRPADSRSRAQSARLAADAPDLDSILPGGAGAILQGLPSGAATVGWGKRAAGPARSSTRPLDHPAHTPKDRAFGGLGTPIFLIGILLNRYPRVTLEQFQVVPTRKNRALQSQCQLRMYRYKIL